MSNWVIQLVAGISPFWSEETTGKWRKRAIEFTSDRATDLMKIDEKDCCPDCYEYDEETDNYRVKELLKMNQTISINNDAELQQYLERICAIIAVDGDAAFQVSSNTLELSQIVFERCARNAYRNNAQLIKRGQEKFINESYLFCNRLVSSLYIYLGIELSDEGGKYLQYPRCIRGDGTDALTEGGQAEIKSNRKLQQSARLFSR